MHNKFQLSSSICRGVMRGTNSRNEKNEKTTSLGLRGVVMGLKNQDPQRSHLRHLLNVHSHVKLPSPIWRKDIREEQHFLRSKGRREPYISPSNWLEGLIFGYVVQLLIFYRLAEKEGVLRFLLLSTPT